MHWSLSIVLLIVIVGGVAEYSLIIGAASFWAIMLVHEIGHMYIARKQGLRVYSIELYLFHGLCHYELSHDKYENYLVAWGGFFAQAVVFVPAIFIYTLFGNFLPWYINTPLIFLGYISALIGLINLAPSKGLDGYICWRLIPIYLRRKRQRS